MSKTCKWCKHGYNYCSQDGLCTYCYLQVSKYPVKHDQDDTCPNWEADEEEDD